MIGKNTLCKAYICEFKKSKRSAAFWLSFIGVMSIVGIFFLIRLIKYEHFIPKDGANPWDGLILSNMFSVGALFLPFYVILLTTLFVQIEHRTNMWKHLKIQPFHFSAIFYGKLMSIVTYIVFTHILFAVMLLMSGYLLGFLRPELKFLEFSPDILTMATYVSQYIISSLAMLIIQFWISMRTSSFVVPIGTGLVFYIAAMILINGWEDIIYFPYAYSNLVTYAGRGIVKLDKIYGVLNINLFSLIYFMVLSVIAYFDIRRLEVK